MTNAIVRRATYTEYWKYEDHLLALDSESRYLRFGYPVSDDGIKSLMQTIYDDKNHHVLFCIEDDKLQFIGVCHIALQKNHEMELAFSVLKEYQGRGIGNALMRRAIAWCRTHNILSGEMVCLASNQRIKRLCAKHGMQMNTESGETLARFKLEIADVATYMQETTDSNIAMLDWIIKRSMKLMYLGK
jgi:RimJ/RimL family protein N-acetyltransferase